MPWRFSSSLSSTNQGDSKTSSFQSNSYFLIRFRVNARTELQLAAIKLALVLAYSFLQAGGFIWALIILLAISGTIAVRLYLTERPFYSSTLNKVLSVLMGIFAWTNYLILFGTILQGANAMFNMLMVMFFLGIPIICALILTPNSDGYLRVLLTPIYKFQKGEEALR